MKERVCHIYKNFCCVKDNMSQTIDFVRSIGFWGTYEMCKQKIFRSFNRWGSSVEKGKDSYTITYIYNAKEYKILCKRDRYNRILHIRDEHKKEVSDHVKPYMGPFLNFHNIPTTPSDLGYKLLTFYMLRGEPKTYNEKDIITI